MKTLYKTAIGVLSLSIIASAQGQADREAAARVRASIKQLEDDDKNSQLSDREVDSNRERHTKAIRSEITRFIEARVRPSESAAQIEARIRSVLGANELVDQNGDQPTVRQAQLRYGRSLIVDYAVPRPPHHDAAMIYAFNEDGGRYRLVASTGEDFEDYSLYTRQVPSPDPQVIYILAGGQAFGYNGSMIRYRLYAFDGATFATLWEPEEVFNARVRVTAAGFAITHIPRGLNDYVTDEYRTTVNGVVRVQ